MENLKLLDKTFNESMFITKVNNIFIMLHSAIMMNDLMRVKHYISDNLEKYYEEVLINLNNKNLRQMYDELNVKSTEILNVSIKDNKAYIDVKIVSRYMDYVVDKDTGDFISGENTRRVEKNNYLTLEKTLSANYKSIARSCPSCGANINVNNNGKCDYCGTIFDTENYDWILVSMKVDNLI